MKAAAVCALVAISALLCVDSAGASVDGRQTHDIEVIIRARWAGTGHADRAVAVARCESGLRARPPVNNPHYGVFQMGRREFARYGRGSVFNARDNIDAAFRYWNATGRTWRPWACKGITRARRARR
jgi:hypothetical protein